MIDSVFLLVKPGEKLFCYDPCSCQKTVNHGADSAFVFSFYRYLVHPAPCPFLYIFLWVTHTHQRKQSHFHTSAFEPAGLVEARHPAVSAFHSSLLMERQGPPDVHECEELWCSSCCFARTHLQPPSHSFCATSICITGYDSPPFFSLFCLILSPFPPLSFFFTWIDVLSLSLCLFFYTLYFVESDAPLIKCSCDLNFILFCLISFLDKSVWGLHKHSLLITPLL